MIKFVYFDVGGVMIRDFSRTNKWTLLQEEVCGLTGYREKFEELWAATGDTHNTTFDVDNLVPTFRKELNPALPADYSFLMGFVNRFEKNGYIWPVIVAMQAVVPVGLLTNMYPRMLEKIYAAGIMPNTEWDVVLDSSVLKLQKPYAEIFALAEKEAGASGSDILFIDNTQKHLDAAANEFGWQTFLFDPSKCEESSSELMQYFNSHV
jgi:FMN phosphatase YigB (HAD superfamily)